MKNILKANQPKPHEQWNGILAHRKTIQSQAAEIQAQQELQRQTVLYQSKVNDLRDLQNSQDSLAAAMADVAAAAAAQSAAAQSGTAQSGTAPSAAREFPTPNRPISRIVAPRWIDEVDRDAFGEAEKVMDILNIRAGQRVADIGAGDGYYVRHLSERVGARGLVYGQDIEPRYLAMLRERVADAKWSNVEVIAGMGAGIEVELVALERGVHAVKAL